MITISTLTAVKKSAWTTTAEATPATEEPGMLARKMPIIAAVPACAGATALIAAPPCEAAHAVLNGKLAVRVRRPEDVPPDQPDQPRLGRLQRRGRVGASRPRRRRSARTRRWPSPRGSPARWRGRGKSEPARDQLSPRISQAQGHSATRFSGCHPFRATGYSRRGLHDPPGGVLQRQSSMPV